MIVTVLYTDMFMYESVELLTEQTNRVSSLSLILPGLTPFPHWILIPRTASSDLRA